MKYTRFNHIPNMPIYFIPNDTLINAPSPSPIPYSNPDIENEDRLIPFVGGAILGGIAGNAIARPYGYYPYPIYNYQYYPNSGYYSYGGGYLPNTYNYYYQIPKNIK